MLKFWKRSKKSEPNETDSKKNKSPFISPEVTKATDDRYMNLAVEKRNWQIAWQLTTAILMISVGVNGFYVVSSKYIPYIVAVDKLGHVVSVGVADKANSVDLKRIIYSEMVDWVEGTRRVVSDQAAQKTFLRRSYARVVEGSSAKKSLDEFVKNTRPFQSGATRTIDAKVRYALPREGNTWEIEWTETQFGPNGDKIGEERWKGIFTYKIVAPDTEAGIRANGVGFFISDFKWSKTIG